MRKCEGCDAQLPPQVGRGKPRKFCVECRPPRNRVNPHVIELPPVRVVLLADAEAGEPDAQQERPLVDAYRAQLERAGRLDCPEGAHVMHLARLLAAGSHTASGAASLSRELRAAMELALAGAPQMGDLADELAARRAEKIANA